MLTGVAIGCFAAVVEHAGLIGMRQLGFPATGPGSLALQLRSVASFRHAIAGILSLLDFAVTTSLEVVVILLVLRIALRYRVPAVLGLYALTLIVFAGPVATLPVHAVIIAVLLATLFRFGILTLMTGVLVFVTLGNFLITLDPGSPFAPVSYLATGLVLGLAIFGARGASTRARYPATADGVSG